MADPYTTIIMGDGEGEPVTVEIDPVVRLERVTVWAWSWEANERIFHADGSVTLIGFIPFRRRND